MEAKKIREYLRLGAVVVLIIAFQAFIYFVHFQEHPEIDDPNLKLREIETPLKLWLNGFLGFLFRFKFIGNLNWLILPLFALELRKCKGLKTEERAFGILMLLSCILIGAQGYFNSRYQVSLLPVSLTIVVVYSYTVFKRYFKVLNIYVFAAMMMFFTLGNSYVFYLEFKKSNNIFPAQGAIVEKFSEIRDYFFKRFEGLGKKEKKAKSKTYPYAYLQFIDENYQDSLIFINNLPAVYYYTQAKGVYYWCGDDLYYTSQGEKKLFETYGIDGAASFVTDSLKCRVLLSFEPYNSYDKRFNEFLEKYWEPVFYSRYDLVLYEFRGEGYYPLEPWKERMKKEMEIEELPGFESPDLPLAITPDSVIRNVDYYPQ